MNNLTTRKIVLGLLMTLVLAFSVQGIADAFTVTASSTSNEFILVSSTGTALNRSFTFGITFDSTQVSQGSSTTVTITPPPIDDGVTLTSFTVSGLTDTDDNSTNSTVSVDPTRTSAYTATVRYTLAPGADSLGVKSFTVDDDGDADVTVHTAYGVRADSQNTFSTLSAGTSSPQTGAESSSKEISVTPSQSWTKVTFSTTSGLLYSHSTNNSTNNYYVSGSKLTTSLPSGSRSITAYSNVAEAVEVQYRATGNTTATVTAMIPGSVNRESTHKVTVFFDSSVRVERTSGNEQFGQVNSASLLVADRQQLIHPLVVRVLDGTRGVGQKQGSVTFAVTGGGGVLRYFSVPLFDNDATDSEQNTASVTVYTDSQGYAKAYLVLGTAVGANTVTATAAGQTTPVTFTATATPAVLVGQDLKIDRDTNPTTATPQRNAQYGTVNTPLTMSVKIVAITGRDDPEVVNNVQVNFQITGGRIYLAPATLDLAEPDYKTSLTTVTETVNTVNGVATVFVQVNNGATATVTAQIVGNNTFTGRHTVTYFWGDPNYDDSGTPTPTPTPTPVQQTNRLTISSSGEGTTRSVTVNAITAAGTSVPGVLVTLSSTDFTLSQAVTTGTPTSITVPSTAGSYTIFARHPTNAYAPGTATVTVAAPGLGTLTISPVGTAVNGVQTVSITARTADNTIPAGALAVSLSGSGFTTTSTSLLNGSGTARVVLPSTAGTYTLTVSATGYNPASTILVVGGGTTPTPTTPTPTTPTPTTPTAEPSSIQISGPATRSGTVNTQLDSPLLARVLDVNGNGVPNARVIFRVRTGQGRLSARGNGRAVGVQTDSSGFARAPYTPISASSTVEAEASGVTRAVTFTITTGAAPTTTTTTTPGDSGTGAPTPGDPISPVVHVGAASRPPMLWVDGGAIYSLVGASPQRFAPSVDNALNIAVGGGKVYWTEKTGESGGTINSANLNGSGVTELTSIFATPIGIAVDVTNSKLYWTNSAGRIQSANLDGSRITNELQNLEGVMDIALAGGNAYWTQGGNVRFVNLRGQKQIRNVSTGTDAAGSLAIGGGKVYWTEMTGDSGGTVNGANLNGTGATQLASILAAPSGIAVDGSRSKLYWTNARGRIQSANLDGSKIKNVVDGLGAPGDMVLSNSISAPAATTTTTTTTTTTASKAKYDVNNDGTVDNADASLVAGAMNTTNAQYDVNSDGVVNFLDLLLVFDNRDASAAGAPTVLGMQLSSVQIDVIEEQIDLLIATNDRSPAAMRTLIYLQQLLATARPEKTQLFANYPNPFNPETWIPYELATDTNVRITIYNAQGVVIRTLQLGQQSAGYYTDRDRAAYWDGRNALGEQVASGIYFYQLETDEMSLMRKMVILK